MAAYTDHGHYITDYKAGEKLYFHIPVVGKYWNNPWGVLVVIDENVHNQNMPKWWWWQ